MTCADVLVLADEKHPSLPFASAACRLHILRTDFAIEHRFLKMAMVDERLFFDIMSHVDRGCRRGSASTTSTSSSGIRRTPTTSLRTHPICRNRRVYFDAVSRSSRSSSSSASVTSSPKQDLPSPGMDSNRPKVMGIHHLKFAVSNLDVSIAWYERVLGGRRVPGLDHTRQDGSRFAAILEMLDWGGLYLELRHTSQRASKERGWDPVTLTAKGKEDLVGWMLWLERWGTVHSPVLVGKRGWILVFEVSLMPLQEVHG